MISIFALVFSAGWAHAELGPVVSTQEAAPTGLDLTGLELEWVIPYAACTIGTGKNRIDYAFDVEKYAVVAKPDSKQPCQLIYTKDGVSSVKAAARNETPDKCYEVADRIILKLEAAGAYCDVADMWQ